MQSDHQGWGPRLQRHLRTQRLRSATQDCKCPLSGFTQFGAGRKRNTGLEHRRVICGDAARRTLPMSPEELLEAAVLVYLRGLGLPAAKGADAI